MNALKESLNRSLSGVTLRPEVRRRVWRAVTGECAPSRRIIGKDKTSGRRFSAALIFALIAALILAGVALAAVITRGFGWYATQVDDPVSQYSMNELEKRATVAGAKREAASGGDAGEARFEVTQAYYDGSRIDVAYRLSAPDHTSDTTWRPTEDELNQMPFHAEGGELAFDDAGVNGRLADDYALDGACALHIHSYFVGEKFLVEGVPSKGWESYDPAWEDGETGGYQILEDLPKQARDRENVTLTFSLTEYDLYYYRVSTGFYYQIVRQDAKMLEPVVIPRGKGRTVNVKASAAFDAYQVIAKASVSPIKVEVLICQIMPEAWAGADPWTRARDLRGVDYIKDYRLFANGVTLASSLSGEGEGAGRLEGELPKAFRKADPKRLYTLEIEAQGVPEGTKEIRLRPVYSMSGENAEEDVVLKVPD